MCIAIFSISGVTCASWFVFIVCICISCRYANVCFKALDDDDNLIGVIVCKLEPHRGGPMRGYIAMLATRKDYRGHGIATSLVKMAIEKMISEDADEVSNLISHYVVLLAYTDKYKDRSRNRSRQHPITTHLREPGLHSHKTTSSILPQRQHSIPTHSVPEARHPMEANVPSGLPYAHVRSCGHARPWLDGRGLDCETSCSDAD
jgi:GNAT superfamily N-acetyltransferase